MTEKLTSRKNEKIQHMKKLGAEKRYRETCGLFLCDGEKLLREAILHNGQIRTVLYCGTRPENLPDEAEVYEVPRDLIEFVSPMKTPQNVLFSCQMPMCEKIPEPEKQYILLENMQDPGNVGTVLRTANAFGIGVILVGTCADPYSPKTVRASMGAVFRQPVYQLDYTDVEKLKDSGRVIFGAALCEGCREIGDVDLSGAIAAIGNEGQGLSDRMLELCTQKMIIPMEPECESLNASAAATVIMWEMRKVR